MLQENHERASFSIANVVWSVWFISVCFLFPSSSLHYDRSLICRLEEVDPRKMKHEEKLAFWINIHNALVMHVINLLNEITNFKILIGFVQFITALTTV